MLTELTFAILKYGFLVLLWIFVACTVRSLYRDIETLSPRKSRAHRRKERAARKAVESPAPVAAAAPSASAATNAKPTLLVIIDGPLAGSSVPLAGNTITLGRSASNTVVLDDADTARLHKWFHALPLPETSPAPEHLLEKEPFLRSLQGFNITIPRKMAVIPMVDRLDESARRYDSVNCVANVDGKLVGYNTDCDGFTMSVKDYPMDGKVLLIGCGGVGGGSGDILAKDHQHH